MEKYIDGGVQPIREDRRQRPVKLARMLEIQSWFDNKDQLAATATSMAKYLQQSEKAERLLEGVAPEYIELLLWAMEQTDSPNPIVRERWWEYRS